MSCGRRNELFLYPKKATTFENYLNYNDLQQAGNKKLSQRADNLPLVVYDTTHGRSPTQRHPTLTWERLVGSSDFKID
jgi:hypothetical protein